LVQFKSRRKNFAPQSGWARSRYIPQNVWGPFYFEIKILFMESLIKLTHHSSNSRFIFIYANLIHESFLIWKRYTSFTYENRTMLDRRK
jgi:hypothetical protein